MRIEAAELIILGCGVYAGIGLLVALVFVFGGAGLIDPAAQGRGLPLRVRVLLFPGLIGLWPVMLWKLFRQRTPPVS